MTIESRKTIARSVVRFLQELAEESPTGPELSWGRIFAEAEVLLSNCGLLKREAIEVSFGAGSTLVREGEYLVTPWARFPLSGGKELSLRLREGLRAASATGPVYRSAFVIEAEVPSPMMPPKALFSLDHVGPNTLRGPKGKVAGPKETQVALDILAALGDVLLPIPRRPKESDHVREMLYPASARQL